MAKIKFTKGELKRQRDALRQFRRYLPTLQLKKQQLQLEIRQQAAKLKQKRDHAEKMYSEIGKWAGLLSDESVDVRRWAVPRRVVTSARNVAGVDLPVFGRAEFGEEEYDLFLTPLWVDNAVESLRTLASARAEIEVIERGIEVLRKELRVTTQRVNLFEKVKIPQALDIIRRIKIYLGDQMANAVGRSKIAKKKIEAMIAKEVAA